jgi:hypothetical protein
MIPKPVVWTAVSLLAAFAAWAVIMEPFTNWANVTAHSPDILLARCKTTPQRSTQQKDGRFRELKDGMIESEIEVLAVLKGSTKPTPPGTEPSRLLSRYWPRQSEQYLIFSSFHDGFYQAIEEYRVVPMGIGFSTNGLAGKSLTEQVNLLLHSRLKDVDREIERLQEEKKRLEEQFPKK